LSSIDHGDDLLSEHHCERIAEQRNRGLFEWHDARQLDELRSWPYRVTEVDVDPDSQPSTTEVTDEPHAHASVLISIAVPNGRCGDAVCVEGHPVRQFDGCNFTQPPGHVIGIIR